MTDKQSNLGPLEPDKKPRKKAKVVLASLLAAAGIAGGTAVYMYSHTAGVPAGIEARNLPMGGEVTITPLRTTTQPARTTQPGAATRPTTQQAEAILKAIERATSGVIRMSESLEIQTHSSTPGQNK